MLRNCTFLYMLALFLFISTPVFSESSTDAVKAVADLRNWSFEQDGIVELNGEWEFYWERLLDPNSLSDSLPKDYIQVPSVWNEGFATYRLIIKFSEEDLTKPKSLYMPSIASAYRLWINGELYHSSGTVGSISGDMRPYNLPTMVPLDNGEEQVEVVLHVSNFAQRKGGIWKPILLGQTKDILKIRDRKLAAEIFLVGALFLMGLYHISLFFIRNSAKSALFFGLFCLSITIRILVSGESLWNQWFPDWPWEWAVKMEYLSLVWGVPLFVYYVFELFPETMANRFRLGTLIWGIGFGLFILMTPARIYTHWMLFIQFCIILNFLYIVYIFILSAIRRKPGSVINLLAITFFFVTVIHDTLYYNLIIGGDDWAPLGLFMFLFAQSLILLRSFSASFDKVESLSEELMILNQTLEAKVQARTKALEQSNAHLELANEELIRLHRSRQNLLSNISHDLRTPLSAIQGYAKAMMDGVIKSDDKQYSSMIYSKTLYMNRIFEDLLDLAKLESGSVKLEEEKVEIQEFIRDLYHKYEFDMVENELYPDFTITGTSFPAHVELDKTRMEQVFSNFIFNAIKYTPKGGSIKVSLDYSEAENNRIRVSVSDNGIGISSEALPYVFDRYYRDRRESMDSISGLGLGLAIAKEIVEYHHGEIGVWSSLHQGSIFYFVLPILDRKEDQHG
ncbi:cell wall metabolism sensor histidine kinase WalK [Ammoniphilus sp. CFH 90114]|uniref:sensor histidine kinase n=1 Tax=Ammoniphilus sp. CFH 90114 TaxID=2493665 RepID=UPI0013E98024|nr:sensor histidine kinase [Ammoniphilus sp. CFH 90114]